MDNNKLFAKDEDQSKLADFREILFTYLVYWKWFVLCAVLSVGYTAFDLAQKNDVYMVSTSILMKNDRNSGAADNIMIETLGLRTNRSNLENETEVMRSRAIMMKVVMDLKVHTSYFQKKGLRSFNIYDSTPISLDIDSTDVMNLRGPIRIDAIPSVQDGQYTLLVNYCNKTQTHILKNDPIYVQIGGISLKLTRMNDVYMPKDDIVITVESPYGKARYLSNSIIPEVLTEGSTILTMSLRTYNVKQAKDILEKVVYYYNELSVNEKNQALINTGRFINERIMAIAAELGDVEKEIESYKKDYKLISPEDNASTALQESNKLRDELYNADMQLNLIDYIESFINDKENQYSIIPELGIENTAFNSMIKNYNQELMSRARLLHSSSENNPAISKIEQNINTLREGVKNGIVSTRQIIKHEKGELKKRASEIDDKINKAPEIERQMAEVMRKQEIKNELYLFLLKKREDNALSLELTVPIATIIDSP